MSFTESGFDIAGIFERHVQTVYRLCYSYLGSAAEAEDATQTVFMKLVDKPRAFESEEHEKAWLIVTAANRCKDVLKAPRVARRAEMPPDVADPQARSETDDTLEAVMSLPEIYRECIYLHYYEGYKTDEIADMLGVPGSTVRNRMADARKMLKDALGGE